MNRLILLGGTLALAGLIAVALPVTARDGDGINLSCGNAISRDEQAASAYAQDRLRRSIEPTLDATTGLPTSPGVGTPRGGYGPGAAADCEGAMNTRRAWTIPLGIAGLVIAAVGISRRPRLPAAAP